MRQGFLYGNFITPPGQELIRDSVETHHTNYMNSLRFLGWLIKYEYSLSIYNDYFSFMLGILCLFLMKYISPPPERYTRQEFFLGIKPKPSMYICE